MFTLGNLPGIFEVCARLVLDLVVHSREGDQSLVIFQWHGVLNVLTVVGVLSIGVSVVFHL